MANTQRKSVESLAADLEEGRKPFLRLLTEAVTALKTIAREKQKQTKILQKLSEDVTNISTDIEEIKQDL